MHCKVCNEEKEIKTPGSYANILVCGHVVVNIPTYEIIKQGATAVEAEKIQIQLQKTEVLPTIDTQEITTRALSGMKKNYDDFFTSESELIEKMIAEHGKDKAILMFTAIHSHMSTVLFTMSRFRNLYFQNIENMRKEIEDKAVKELIAGHDFYYKDIASTSKPKKVNTPLSKTGTQMDKAREHLKGLTDDKGNPLDITKVLGGLMWKQSKEKEKKEEEKKDYKASLDAIANSITKKEDKAS